MGNPPGSPPVSTPTSPATTQMRPAYHADSNTGVVSQRLTSGAVASRLCWHCWCSSSCRRCGGCAQATYCSAVCGRDDWPRHREWCTFDTVRLLRRRLPDLVVLQILHHANIRVPRHMRLRIGDSHPARLGADAAAMTRTVSSCIADTRGTDATGKGPTVLRCLTLPCRYAASLALRCPARCLTVGLTESLAKE